MPSVRAVHVDRPLTDISVKYRNPGYVADDICPPVDVVKESDKYWVYGRENFRIPNALRADKTETREVQWTVSTDAYLCEEYGLHELISDRERGNADAPLVLDVDTTEHLTDVLTLDREYRIANNILDSTNADWGAYSSTHFENLLNAWDDTAGADPRGDILHAKFMVFRDSRKQANTILIPVEVAYQLMQMNQIEELRKYTDPNLLTNGGLPPVIWGLRVKECQSSYDAASEGAAADYTETWGNNVVIAYVNPAAMSIKSLTFSVRFRARNFMVKKWREEKRESDCIEATEIYDDKKIAPACGFVYTNVITPAA